MLPRSLFLVGLILLAPLGDLANAQQPKPPPLASLVASLPGDAMWVLVLRPKQMFDRAESRGKTIITWMHLAHAQGLVPIPPIRPTMTLLDYLGVEPSEVTEVAYAHQKMVIPKLENRDPEEEPLRLRPQPEGEMILLRLAKPIDQMRARQVLQRVSEVQFQGKSYFGTGADGEQRAMAFPDDHSLVVGSETQVRKFLAGAPAVGRLTKAIAGIQAADDMAFVADVPRVAPFLPGPISLAAKGTEAQIARVVVRTGPQVSATAIVSFSNPEAVEEAKEMVTSALESGKTKLEAPIPLPESATPEDRGVMQTLLDKARKGLASITMKKGAGNTLQVELPSTAGIAIDEDYGLLIRNDKKITLAELQQKLAEMRYRPADPLAAEMQRLIPAATGIVNADFFRIATAATVPKPSDLADQSFTLQLLVERPIPKEVQEKFPERAKELRALLGDIAIKPSELVGGLSESSWFGYGTLIDFDMIRQVECQAQGDQATGKAKFKVSIIWEGEFEFSARRGKAGWEISEIRMPGHGLKLVRGTNRLWARLPIDHLAGNAKPREVKGVVTINGKPAEGAHLDFFARPTVELFPMKATDAEGRFTGELPPGKYVVAVHHEALKRPDGPDEFSDLKVVELEVPEKGEAALKIEVSSN